MQLLLKLPSAWVHMDGRYICCMLVLTISLANSIVPWHLINLPDEHVPYYFFSRPKLKNLCSKSAGCPYQVCESYTKL